jgi:hypothetical protein
LEVEPELLVIVPVSALSHQMALGDPDEEHASGIPALEVAIETSISARAGSLLASVAVTAQSEAFERARENGAVRLAALSEGRTPEILAIQATLAERRKWLEDLTTREPQWCQQLKTRLDLIGRDTYHELNGGLHTIRSDATAQLESAAADLDTNVFTSRVINDVHDQYVRSAHQLEDRVNEALADLAAELKLSFERVQADTTFHGTQASAFVEPTPARVVTGSVRRTGEAANRAARKASGWRAFGIGAGFVAAVAATVLTGGAAAPLIVLGAGAVGAAGGAAVATAAATALTLRQELDSLDRADPETRRRRLKQHVVDGLTPNQSEATDRLARVTDTLLATALKILRDTIRQEQAAVTARIEQLSADLDLSRQEAAREADRVRPELAELADLLIPQAADLRRRIDAEIHNLSFWVDADGEGGAGP